jgi:hypothetical protein
VPPSTRTVDDMKTLFGHTLLAKQVPDAELRTHFGKALKWLSEDGLIESRWLDPKKTQTGDARSWAPSPMGRAVFASGARSPYSGGYKQAANRYARVRPRGDRNGSLNEGQIPNFRGVRVHVRTGYNRAEES